MQLDKRFYFCTFEIFSPKIKDFEVKTERSRNNEITKKKK